MIFVDTNYFLRFLLADNLPQYTHAKELITQASEGKKEIFTSLVVIFEIYWVMTSFYQKNKTEIAQILKDILDLSFISLKERKVLQHAVDLYKDSSLDLEDSYNLAYAKNEKASEFRTFDVKLQKMFSK
jgi:predicted nucleic-acid-binding protein